MLILWHINCWKPPWACLRGKEQDVNWINKYIFINTFPHTHSEMVNPMEKPSGTEHRPYFCYHSPNISGWGEIMTLWEPVRYSTCTAVSSAQTPHPPPQLLLYSTCWVFLLFSYRQESLDQYSFYFQTSITLRKSTAAVLTASTGENSFPLVMTSEDNPQQAKWGLPNAINTWHSPCMYTAFRELPVLGWGWENTSFVCIQVTGIKHTHIFTEKPFFHVLICIITIFTIWWF